jgi:alanine dehydrogenase
MASALAWSDAELAKLTEGVVSRQDLFEQSDVVLLAKPSLEDFRQMKEGTIHWGWPHCVQQRVITQEAIDRKLTLIAWEAMHRWSKHGDWQMHVFSKNNEIAGYAGVFHAMGLNGIDGNYGPQRKAVVLSFGSVSRGAVRALQALGVQDITVFTQRYHFLVADQMAGVNYYHFETTADGQLVSLDPGRENMPFIEELADADIIVNGTLQDTDNPLMFVEKGQLDRLRRGCLIVDISCDEGMGFYFAKPTTFANPTFKEGPVHYYAVDHTPSYLWNAATWEISECVIPYLPLIMEGPRRWAESETLSRAIEIDNGVIQNPKILTFQNRGTEYPHAVL